MNDFILGKCILCNIGQIRTMPFQGYESAAFFDCPNCGTYIFSSTIFPFGLFDVDANIKSLLSYYIRHHQNQDKTIYIGKDKYNEIIQNCKLPSASEHIDNFLKWFGNQSNNSFDSVDGFTSHLSALIGTRNQQQVINLLDQLVKDGYIEMENPISNLRERPPFNAFCGHLTSIGIGRLEEINRTNALINFHIPQLSIEKLLKDESNNFEVKASIKLNLNRLLKGDGVVEKENGIALDGVLKTVTAFLNSTGGNILIGALENNKFNSNEISKISYKAFSNYYLIGILIENPNLDKYQLSLRELITSHISKEVAGLIDINYKEFEGFTFCIVSVNKANHKWYYLDGKFFVRDGNRTMELIGENADLYKKRNSRYQVN